MSGGLFRFMGGLARNMVIANTFGSFALLIVMALGGFLLTRERIMKWWIWGYWISPLMYVQNAISVNEFMGHSWDKVVNGERIGTTFLNSRGIFAESRWYWIGCGALIGFILLFNFLYTLAVTFLELPDMEVQLETIALRQNLHVRSLDQIRKAWSFHLRHSPSLLMKSSTQWAFLETSGHFRRKTQTDLINSLGSMYTATLVIGIQNSSTVMPIVSIERTVFYRERAAGMYSALPYAFGQAIIELPYVFAQALAYCLVVYAMIGFDWTAAKFFWYLYFSYFTLLYFPFYGMMCVGFTPNYNVASIVSAAFYNLWNLFSGFLITKTQIPGWWIWYYWISPVAWTLYGLVVSQYGDITEQMEDGTPQTVKDYVESYFGFKITLFCHVNFVIVCFLVNESIMMCFLVDEYIMLSKLFV